MVPMKTKTGKLKWFIQQIVSEKLLLHVITFLAIPHMADQPTSTTTSLIMQVIWKHVISADALKPVKGQKLY